MREPAPSRQRRPSRLVRYSETVAGPGGVPEAMDERRNVQGTLRIVSTASEGHVVDAYHGVVCALRGRGLRVEHVGISSDQWYPREGRARYSNYGYVAYDLPRPSGRETPWWSTVGVQAEAVESISAVQSMVRELWSLHGPSVFLLADDRGPLEVTLIREFKLRGCAVVLLEHGYGHVELPGEHRETPVQDAAGSAARVRAALGGFRG